MPHLGTITIPDGEERTVPIEYYGRIPPVEGIELTGSQLSAVDDQETPQDVSDDVLKAGYGTISGYRLFIPTKSDAGPGTYTVTVEVDLSNEDHYIDTFTLVIE